MRSNWKYVILLIITSLMYYFSYNGSYIKLKQTAIMNEFYVMPTYGELKIERYNEGLTRSGLYRSAIEYAVEANSKISLNNYMQVFSNMGWVYIDSIKDTNTTNVVGYRFAKDKIVLYIYLNDSGNNRVNVSMGYFYSEK